MPLVTKSNNNLPKAKSENPHNQGPAQTRRNAQGVFTDLEKEALRAIKILKPALPSHSLRA